MNERIEQLMNQASHGACYDGPLDVNLTGNEIEKFAELIVRECEKINIQELSFAAYGRLRDRYEERFGVE